MCLHVALIVVMINNKETKNVHLEKYKNIWPGIACCSDKKNYNLTLALPQLSMIFFLSNQQHVTLVNIISEKEVRQCGVCGFVRKQCFLYRKMKKRKKDSLCTTFFISHNYWWQRGREEEEEEKSWATEIY